MWLGSERVRPPPWPITPGSVPYSCESVASSQVERNGSCSRRDFAGGNPGARARPTKTRRLERLLSQAGAVDFFTKPLVADVLLGAIRNAINRSCAALWNAGSLRSL